MSDTSSLAAPPADLPADPGQSYNPENTALTSGRPPDQAGQPAAPARASATLAHWVIADRPAPELAPAVPRYVRRRVAGRGGFGEVWEATQVSLGRSVALKFVRRELLERAGPGGARSIAAAFRREALATARLDHPNIVPIHDLGLDESGQPVLAMHFVRGRVWSELIAEEFPLLAPADFLARHLPTLMQVAQAVAYAHARGLVHRDVKPAQVMVGEYGEVLLMDWGLSLEVAAARPAEALLAADDDTLALLPTHPAGTVAFMAPEQTEPTPVHIGPWTDVYLLGGTLYVLLTGGPPHDAADARQAFRQAQAGEVVPPAQRVPGRELPEELVSLAMEALAARSEARLPTARAFLTRLQDHLSGTTRRRDAQARVAAAEQRLRTAEGYADFSELLHELAGIQALWPATPGLGPLRQQALLAFARGALDEGDLELARVQAEATAEPERGRLLASVEAARARREAQARQRKLALRSVALLALALLAFGGLYLRTLARERDLASRARAQEAVARHRAEDLMGFMLTDLSDSLEPIGRLDLLDQVANKALQHYSALPAEQVSDEDRAQRARALDTVGQVLQARGDSQGAAASWAEARRVREALVAADASRLDWQADLGVSRYHTAKALRAQGEASAALREYAEAGRAFAELIERDPGQPLYRQRLAMAHSSAGELLNEQGRPREALEELRASLALFESVVDLPGASLDRRQDVAVEHSRIGDALDALGDTEGALAEYRAYQAGIEALARQDSRHLPWQRELAVTHNSVGWALRKRGDLAGALVEFQAQRAIMERLVRKEPDNSSWQRELAFAQAVIGRVLGGQGRRAEAVRSFEASQAILAEFARRDPRNRAWQRDAAVSRTLLGEALAAGGAQAAALEQFDAAAAALEPLVQQDPGNGGYARDLAQVLRLAGGLRREGGQAPRGRAELERAAQLLLGFTRERDVAPAAFLDTRASALLLLGRQDEARALVDELFSRGYSDAAFVGLARRHGWK